MPTATRAYQLSIKLGDDDPLHLNNVNVLPERLRDRFPMARPGDILVSLRNLNLLAFIDRETRLFKWALTGHWVRQHDPDLLDNGNIMLFDNSGGIAEHGGSRILEIEPSTQRIVWSFEGSEDEPFEAPTQGEQQWLDGTVLIAEPLGGRAIEVTHATPPQLVWEYVNLRQATETGGVVERVVHALRYPREALPFLSAQ